MDESKLDFQPLYSQVEKALRKYIEDSDLKPGQPLPPEEQLQSQFGVSRNTIRRALDRMMSAGMIQRRQGKGTFVAEPKLELEFTHVSSFTVEIRKRGMEPSSQILRAEICLPSAHVTRQLRLNSKEKIICLDQLRFADAIPIAVFYDHIPLKVAPDLILQPMASQSLCEEFERRYNIVLERCEDVITASLPTVEQAGLLGIPENQAVLSVMRTSYNGSGLPVLFSSNVIRGDMWHYVVTARGPYTESRLSRLASEQNRNSVIRTPEVVK